MKTAKCWDFMKRRKGGRGEIRKKGRDKEDKGKKRGNGMRRGEEGGGKGEWKSQ